MFENFTAPYMPEEREVDLLDGDVKSEEVKVVNYSNHDIVNYRGIPCSINLMKAEAAPPEEIEEYKQRRIKVFEAKHGKNKYIEDLMKIDPMEDPEKSLKDVLESLTLLDGEFVPNQPSRVTKIDKEGFVELDYKEALDFSQSKYAKFFRYY